MSTTLTGSAVHDWHVDALCAQVGTEPFFPAKGEPSLPARQVCAACPVQRACGVAAVERGEWDGIWGGMTVPQLRARVRAAGGPWWERGEPAPVAAEKPREVSVLAVDCGCGLNGCGGKVALSTRRKHQRKVAAGWSAVAA